MPAFGLEIDGRSRAESQPQHSAAVAKVEYPHNRSR